MRRREIDPEIIADGVDTTDLETCDTASPTVRAEEPPTGDGSEAEDC